MSISGINTYFKPIEGLVKPNQAQPGEAQTAGAKSFGDMFKDALKEVNDLQNQADQKITGLTMGQAGVTSHDAMIALEKADVAFNLMTAIRSRIVRAYEEVMRTQV